jgi:hypothetical protein
VAAGARVVHRRAANSAAGSAAADCLEIAHDRLVSVRGDGFAAANPGRSKNRAPQDCFGGWHRIIWTNRFSAGRH